MRVRLASGLARRVVAPHKIKQNKAVPHRYSGRMLSAPTPPSLCHPERQRRIRLSRPFAERQETGERILRFRLRMTEKEG